MIGAVAGACTALVLAVALLLCVWRRLVLRRRSLDMQGPKDSVESCTTVKGAAVQLASPRAPGSIVLQVCCAVTSCTSSS